MLKRGRDSDHRIFASIAPDCQDGKDTAVSPKAPSQEGARDGSCGLDIPYDEGARSWRC